LTIYSNGAPVRLAIPDGVPASTRPILRLVPSEDDRAGSLYATDGSRLYTVVPGEYRPGDPGLWISARGHWYLTGEAFCRGCGLRAHLNYIAGETAACPKRPSAQDIADALLRGAAVAR